MSSYTLSSSINNFLSLKEEPATSCCETILSTNDDDFIDCFFTIYPLLADRNNNEWLKILRHTQLTHIKKDTYLADNKSCCTNLVLLLTGTLRVFQFADDGREVTLFRITPGNICPLSLSNLLNNTSFNTRSSAETDCEVIILTPDLFAHAMDISEKFRQFVFINLANRFQEVISTLYNTQFEKLEMRLACLLGKLFERNQSNTINITHQQLAQELGSTREVISRVLKQLAEQGCIKLSRGKIHIGESNTLPYQNNL
jgi:CRP/FNR family transcriptional regulator